MQIKITFRNETKKLRKTTEYSSLQAQAQKSFGDLSPSFKFYYVDSEQDIISITCQDDLDEALECMQG